MKLSTLAREYGWPSTQIRVQKRWASARHAGWGVAPVEVNGELCIGLYCPVYLDETRWTSVDAAIQTLWPWDALSTLDAELGS